MSKRERIILIILGLAVVYGAYSLFFSGPKRKGFSGAEGRMGELNKMITELAAGLSKEGPTEVDTYISDLAENKWGEDPFLDSRVTVEKERKRVPQGKSAQAESAGPVIPDVKLTYTGYLRMGEIKIAIIDGMEYEKGDELKGGGFVVRDIFPNRVVIGVVGIEGKKGEFTVPKEEEIM